VARTPSKAGKQSKAAPSPKLAKGSSRRVSDVLRVPSGPVDLWQGDADTRVAMWRDSTLRNVFYILRQRLNEPGMDFYSQGADRYENQPVDVVDITDANGLTVTVSFSQLTKLPVRQVFRRRNPEDNQFDTEETSFARYRDIGGGVKWPENIRRVRNGEKIYEIYSESVKINQGLKDDLFTLPEKLKVLPKAK
jgi:uncharacterized protein (DUF2384 family)